MSKLYEDIKKGLEEAIAFEQGDPDAVAKTVVHTMKVNRYKISHMHRGAAAALKIKNR